MRYYHIYKQETQDYYQDTTFGNFRYQKLVEKWKKPEYIGYVCGTRELYEYFRKIWTQMYWSKGIAVTDHFCEGIVKKNPWAYCPTVLFMIVDDSGNTRDLFELTDKYAKKHWKCGRASYQYRHGMHIMSELRQKASKEDDEIAKSEYAITLKNRSMRKRWNDMSWDFNYGGKKSKSWKDQSKRKHQYKPVQYKEME